MVHDLSTNQSSVHYDVLGFEANLAGSYIDESKGTISIFGGEDSSASSRSWFAPIGALLGRGVLSNVVYSLFFRVWFSGRYRVRGGCDLDALWGDKLIPG